MQRELTATLGTAGATHVRFLFGFPFALIFLAAVADRDRRSRCRGRAGVFWPWILDGALAQIAATALMLAAMGERSFVVTIAYIKTEPVQVALFGLIFLGDARHPAMVIAILIATAGVLVMSLKPGGAANAAGSRHCSGLSAGAMFALSAIGYRGAILSLQWPDFVMAATFTLVVGLVAAGGTAVDLSLAAQTQGDARHHGGMAAVDARGLFGRARLAILVSRFRHRDGGERAHARAGRGAVRAGDFALHFQAADLAARGAGHRADRGGRVLLCCS